MPGCLGEWSRLEHGCTSCNKARYPVLGAGDGFKFRPRFRRRINWHLGDRKSGGRGGAGCSDCSPGRCSRRGCAAVGEGKEQPSIGTWTTWQPPGFEISEIRHQYMVLCIHNMVSLWLMPKTAVLGIYAKYTRGYLCPTITTVGNQKVKEVIPSKCPWYVPRYMPLSSDLATGDSSHPAMDILAMDPLSTTMSPPNHRTLQHSALYPSRFDGPD